MRKHHQFMTRSATAVAYVYNQVDMLIVDALGSAWRTFTREKTK